MIPASHRIAALLPVLMTGLMAGFFYAFSVCVMGGLDRTEPAAAIAAMQGINEAVRNPVFFVTFFLTPAIALGSAAFLHATGASRSAVLVAVSAAIYLVAVAMTAIVNVPMNEALALVEPDAPDAARIWADYSARWTFWNTARTFASLAALAVAGLAVTARPGRT